MKKLCALCLFLCSVLTAAAASAAVPTTLRQVQQRSNGILPRGEKLPELSHDHTGKCPPRDRDKVHIVCILDRSGSMQRLTGDTIGGCNSFIDKQRQESASAVVTTVLFDHQYEILCSDKPIKDAAELTEREYFARGRTALLDAVGYTVLLVDGDFRRNGTCPKSEPAIFMVMTDGLENASREFSRAAVRKLISDAQEKYGWQFIFMGANIDSAAEAGSLGIRKEAAMDYAADSKGVGAVYESAGEAVKMLREKGQLDGSWKKAPAPEKK